MTPHRSLTDEEIRRLEASGCTCESWTNVLVGDGFDATSVRNVHFAGRVKIGALQGTVAAADGPTLPAGLYDARLIDCEVGDDVRIARIGSYIARMRIGDRARVEDVGEISTSTAATFGNGVEAAVANEGGAREVPLFDRLSSQFAYLYAFYGSRPGLKEGLRRLADERVTALRSDFGEIGEGAVVARVQEMTDVRIGPHAVISGALRLRNGTVLSEAAAPTHVGSGVIAEDFIVAEGAVVDGAAILSRTFVGQGVRIGKQFSAENSLFFANSECLHGEACSVFGGPYTVSHHKGTLLIAGTFSFYNAGSGTNQSNHMYKLGPVHQGVVERGSKSGSSSYLLWPGAIGPFSVVIGKHMTNVDTRDLPFSYLIEERGESVLTPAMNLNTVGTMRDTAKWPTRDRRTCTAKRDRIRFELYGPYVVGRMIVAEGLLRGLYAETPREVERVRYKGAVIKRLMLRHAARQYTQAIDAYLHGKVLARLHPKVPTGAGMVLDEDDRKVAPAVHGIYSEGWVDVGGLQVGRARLDALIADVATGKIGGLDAFDAAIHEAHDAYEEDEWAWVRCTFEDRTGQSVDDLSAADLSELRAAHTTARTSALKKVLADAANEFGETARYGYGVDGNPEADFAAVRGTFEENAFVRQVQTELEELTMKIQHKPHP